MRGHGGVAIVRDVLGVSDRYTAPFSVIALLFRKQHGFIQPL